MTLETIYYITQIFAVLAILVSLIAIYFQQRQQNRHQNAEAARDFAAMFQEFLAASYNDAEFARLTRVWFFYPEVLSANQRFICEQHHGRFAFYVEAFDYQQVEQVVGRELKAEAVQGLVGFSELPGPKAWWAYGKYQYTASFRNEIDGLIRTADNSDIVKAFEPLRPTEAEIALIVRQEAELLRDPGEVGEAKKTPQST